MAVKKEKQLQLRRCKICGKAFVGSADPFAKSLCPDCMPKADRALNKVREYLHTNPRRSLTIQELAEKIGEPPKVIQALYDDESITRGEKKKPSPIPKVSEKNLGSRKKFSHRYRKEDSKE